MSDVSQKMQVATPAESTWGRPCDAIQRSPSTGCRMRNSQKYGRPCAEQACKICSTRARSSSWRLAAMRSSLIGRPRLTPHKSYISSDHHAASREKSQSQAPPPAACRAHRKRISSAGARFALVAGAKESKTGMSKLGLSQWAHVRAEPVVFVFRIIGCSRREGRFDLLHPASV